MSTPTPTPTPRTYAAKIKSGFAAVPDQFYEFTRTLETELSALRAEVERLRSDRDCEKRLRKDADEFRENAIERAQRAEADLAFQVARNSDLFTQRDEAFESQEKAETELAVERDQIAQLVITKVKACTAAADNKAEADQWRAKLQRAEREVYRLEGCCGELQSIIDNQGYPSGTDYAKMEARAELAEAELATERARLDAVISNSWLVYHCSDSSFAVFSNICADYVSPWLATKRSAIDAAMKEGAK